ncbi:type II toxin-antitoxin system RelE/ParE family toxin [Bosea sp. 685]|nr:type II toxin-antitoxin system RelE/ParE family toxin [Bosea sp. 685]WNJ93885.1 type II toxin-antitoxin system RelE/ParE family toxin [Bosea sp. 685]
MILSYRDKRTERFAEGDFVKDFQGFERQAWKRLDDLRALPNNRLESLKGDRSEQFSIRINQQWRLCFAWPQGNAGPSQVEIVDYH